MARENVARVVMVAAGDLSEFADFILDRLIIANGNVIDFRPGAPIYTVDGMEYRYIRSAKSMEPADGYEFYGSWYLREDSKEILARAQEISSV